MVLEQRLPYVWQNTEVKIGENVVVQSYGSVVFRGVVILSSLAHLITLAPNP